MFNKNVRYFIVLTVLAIAATPLIDAVNSAFEYPLDTKTTLTYLMELPPNLVAAGYQNFGDTVLATELAKRTGVKCRYIHPAEGRTTQTIELLAVSGMLPDIMEDAWAAYPGGPEKAVTKGVILPLNKIYQQYAPHLRQWIKNHPDWERSIKDDLGDYYVFPFLKTDNRLLVTDGPVIRKDWLEELKLAAPGTPVEWYNVLKAFKERKGAIAPLSMSLAQLQTDVAGGFNVCGERGGFYVEDRIVKYSFNTPQYKRFLLAMNRWFAAGLLDSKFANLTSKMRTANLYTGKTGIVSGSVGNVGAWQTAMRRTEPKFQVLGLKYPAPQKGKKSKFAQRTPGYDGNDIRNAALGGRCKNIEAAARMLDYNYSDAGNMLLNFGVENISYKLVNNYPQFTELITKNPQLTMGKALDLYTRANSGGPFILDIRSFEQYYKSPQQQMAQKQWRDNDYQNYALPLITLNEPETLQVAPIVKELQRYVTAMSSNFIMGIELFDRYEAYADQIEKIGIDRVLSIYQKAYDRYLRR
jgi:putative aldouronate transport system substrate-binding protein